MKRASYSCCNFFCVVLAAAYLKYRRCRLSCLPFVWHFFHCDTHTHTHTHGWVSQVFALTDARCACPRSVIGSTVGAYPRGTGSNPVEGNGHFFPSYRQLYLSSFSETLRPTQRRSLQMPDVAVLQIGVGVFDAWLFHDGAGGWVSEVLVSADARRACPRSVIGSTVGAYPRGTGLNPVEGNGHFFPSYRQRYLSSFSDTHIHTHAHTHHTQARTHACTHTHTHTLASYLNFLVKKTFHCASKASPGGWDELEESKCRHEIPERYTYPLSTGLSVAECNSQAQQQNRQQLYDVIWIQPVRPKVSPAITQIEC